jgi:hypothetical protein
MQESFLAEPKAWFFLQFLGLGAAIRQLVGDAALQQQLQALFCTPCSSAERLVSRLLDKVTQHILQQMQTRGQVESGVLQLSKLLAGIGRELQEQQQHSLQQPLQFPRQEQQERLLQPQQQQEQQQQQVLCESVSNGNGSAASLDSLRNQQQHDDSFAGSELEPPDHSRAAAALAEPSRQELPASSSAGRVLSPVGVTQSLAAAAAAVATAADYSGAQRVI